MNIPKKIKVGGQDYSIEIADEIIDTLNPVGRMNPRRGIIELRKTADADFLNATFLHEVIHALHDHMGLSQVESNDLGEDYVDGLANALYMFIKDNPQVFKK